MVEQCQATTESGEQCQNKATEGEYCWVPTHGGGEDAENPGRPDKFTEERAEQACEMAKHGASIEGCARAAGVSGQTLHNWLDDRPDFFEDFRQARAEGEKQRLAGDSQQDRFLLARSFGYEKTEHQDVTSDGDKVDAAPMVVLPSNGKRKDGGE